MYDSTVKRPLCNTDGCRDPGPQLRRFVPTVTHCAHAPVTGGSRVAVHNAAVAYSLRSKYLHGFPICTGSPSARVPHHWELAESDGVAKLMATATRSREAIMYFRKLRGGSLVMGATTSLGPLSCAWYTWKYKKK